MKFGSFNKASATLRFMFFAVAVLLAWPHPVAGQSVGPSGCVANCGTGGGGGGGGGGYNPYAGAAAGALGAFMNGFMNQMLKQPSPKQRAYALNEQGNAAYNRDEYMEAVRLYEAALKLDPLDSVIRNNLKSARKWARRELEKQRKKADAKRKADREQANKEVELAGAEVRVARTFTNFSDQLDVSSSGAKDMEMLNFDDPNISPSGGLDKEKESVGTRLKEIEGKILDAPAGKSTWDGGYGGTLDSPEAAGVSQSAGVVDLRKAQTGVPRYEKAAPATQTDVAMLGARVTAEEKAKNAEAAVSIAGTLAKKEDYDGSLRYLKEAKTNNPDQPGLDETIAYVKGMKAAKFPADRTKSPSPKADIILDALTVGDGNWKASISYLEGMKQKSPTDLHVTQALNYTRGMYDYQILKQSQTIDPKLDKEAPLFFSGKSGASEIKTPTDEKILKQAKTLPPQEEEPHFFGNNPPKVDRALLAQFEGPEGETLALHLMDKEVRRIVKGIEEKYIRTTAGEGLDAIGRKDFGTAHEIFSSLHRQYPENLNLRDTANYVAGLYHAQQKTR